MVCSETNEELLCLRGFWRQHLKRVSTALQKSEKFASTYSRQYISNHSKFYTLIICPLTDFMMSNKFPSESGPSRYRDRLSRGGRGTEGVRGQNSSGYYPGARGSYRGAKTSSWHKPDPTPDWECQGKLLATITLNELTIKQIPSIISDVEYIASYNWLDRKTPTILVPGKFWECYFETCSSDGHRLSPSVGPTREESET